MSISCRSAQRLGMKVFAFDEISLDRKIRRGAFPLKFGRQTRAAPICECVRFEITHVRNRFRFLHRTEARKCKIPPRAVALHPIERRLPTLFVHCHPTKCKPKFWPRVTACFDKFEILAVGYDTACEREM